MTNRGWRPLFSSNVLLPCRHLLHLPVITNTSSSCNQHRLSVARRCNQLWATVQSASNPSLLPTLATPVKLTARLTPRSSSIWCPAQLYPTQLLGKSVRKRVVISRSFLAFYRWRLDFASQTYTWKSQNKTILCSC